MNGSKGLVENGGPGDNPSPDEGRWEEAEGRDRNLLLNVTLFSNAGDRAVEFRHLGRRVIVDFGARCFRILNAGTWEPLDHPLLEMVSLVYLGKVDAVYPVGEDIVSCRDLKESHFFNGFHEFRLDELKARYGNDPEGFRRAAERLGGSPVPMADAACRLMPFPRVPLYYLLWTGDDEFEPRFSVLFDRSIERTFHADAVWALVNLTSTELLSASARN